MTQPLEDFLEGAPPPMRDRLMSMEPAERERLMERRRRMFESMGGEARDKMRQVHTYMRDRPSAPELGNEAPDFDLAVLDGSGERVRLKDLRGRPVGLIFGSYT